MNFDAQMQHDSDSLYIVIIVACEMPDAFAMEDSYDCQLLSHLDAHRFVRDSARSSQRYWSLGLPVAMLSVYQPMMGPCIGPSSGIESVRERTLNLNIEGAMPTGWVLVDSRHQQSPVSIKRRWGRLVSIDLNFGFAKQPHGNELVCEAYLHLFPWFSSLMV